MSFGPPGSIHRRDWNLLSTPRGGLPYPPDPFIANVTLLLWGDSFTDLSPLANVGTNSGMTIVADSNTFLGSSIQNTSTVSAQSVTYTNTFALGSGESYTVEAFIRWTGGITNDAYAYPRGIALELLNATDPPIFWAGRINGSSNMTVGRPAAGATIPPTYSSSVLNRIHYAWVRNIGVNDTVYINGRYAANGNFSTANLSSIAIGWRGGSTRPTSAAFDQIRITRGVARYVRGSANPGDLVFTPPTQPFAPY